MAMAVSEKNDYRCSENFCAGGANRRLEIIGKFGVSY
jgi:hypothetical protein